MKIEQVKIRVSDLTLGMFVSKLDCPWSQTPFPLQGFLLKTPADIDTLRAYCDEVYIDVTKGRGPLGEEPHIQVTPSQKGEASAFKPLGRVRPARTTLEIRPLVVKRHVYADVAVPLKVEIRVAEKALKTLRGHLILATKQISKGREFNYPELKKSVNEMVESIVRCPDAFTWLMKLRAKDVYTHDHSMRTALWASQFGRFIGLSKDEISTLTIGTLLKDIGKTQLPDSILNARVRTEAQEEEYRRFIEYGVNMLKQSNADLGVISVVRHHCERHDGSGFPQGLSAGKIPLLSRIAGVATVYDLISSPRGGGDALSPSKAISALYNMRGKAFQDDLVVQFIQSVGLYPTGTLVEITTGDIGVVVEQHPKSRLTPQVAIVSGPVRPVKSKQGYLLIDLKDEEQAREQMMDAGYARASQVSKLAIARDLEFAGHDVKMDEVSRLFMDSVESQIESIVDPEGKQNFFSRVKKVFQRAET